MKLTTLRKTIYGKITILFSILLLFIFIIVGTAFTAFKLIESDGNAINISGSERMRTMLLGFTANRYNYVTEKIKDPTEAKKILKVINTELKIYQRFLTGLQAGDESLKLQPISDTDLIDAFDEANNLWEPYKKAIQVIISNSSSKVEKNQSLRQVSYWKALELKNAVHITVELFNHKTNQKITLAKTILTAFLILGIVSFVLTIFLIRRFTGPLHKLSNTISDISGGAGDLTYRLEIETDDEIGQVTNHFNIFIGNLQTIISQVKGISIDLAASMEEHSSTTNSLSDNMQNLATKQEDIITESNKNADNVSTIAFNVDVQANSFQSLTNRMQELSGAIEDVSQESQKAMNLSGTISDKIESGKSALDKTSEIISSVGESSHEMGSIMQIINDIADQINLLSLNASIESARAGDAGRGFAVVADEISKLADQTGESIKNIGDLISSNEVQIESGIQSVQQTVATINEILEYITDISSTIKKIYDFMQVQIEYNRDVNRESQSVKALTEEINESIEEHQTSTETIKSAIQDISELSQGTAAAAEELSATSDGISRMAESLKLLTDAFKTM